MKLIFMWELDYIEIHTEGLVMSTCGCAWEDIDRDDGSNEHISILDKFRISVNYWEVMRLLKMEPIWRE